MSRDALPSLRALGVFETAARYQNFTAAARELNVTQAAVSKTIQLLEADLGRPLFTRSGRTLRLTPAGRDLFERTRSALDYLEEGCVHLRAAGGQATVTIAANTAVSHFWLGPRLRRYADDAPDDPVRLITSDRDRDLSDQDNDLSVLYGYEPRMGWRQAKLFDESLVPVAARRYLEEADLVHRLPLEPDAIAGLSVLDYELQGAGWTNFGTWVEWAGAVTVPGERHRVFSSYALAVDAMLDGEGVALASRPLLLKLLEGGDIVEVSDLRLCTDRAYFLSYRADRELAESARRLFEWLVASAAPPGRETDSSPASRRTA